MDFESTKETSDDEIDLGEVFNSVKNKFGNLFNLKYVYEFLLMPIIWLTLWIRTRNLGLLEGQYLLGLDPYYYYRMANEVLTTGSLPAFDTMRIFPWGKEVGFNFFPYFLAYWNKFLNIFTDITLMQSNIIYGPIFTALSVVFLYLFLKNVFSKKVALLAPLILILSPSYLFRTVAGFADHEALFMFFLFLILWLFSEMKIRKKFGTQLGFAGAAGVTTFLAATTWEAIPILTMPIGAFILMDILWSNRSKKNFAVYSVWLASFLIPLLFFVGFKAIKDISVLAPLFGVVSLGIYVTFGKKNILRLPSGLASILLVAIGGITISVIFNLIDFKRIWAKALTPAEMTGRVAETISEIIGGTALFNTFGWLSVLALFGVVIAAYYGFENRHNKLKAFLAGSTFTVVGLLLFSGKSALINMLLLLVYAASFFGSYLVYKNFNSSSNTLIVLPLLMFIFASYLVSAGTRFLFLFAPLVAIFVSYFIFKTIDLTPKKYKIVVVLLTIAVMSPIIYDDFKSTSNQAKYMASSLPGSWQSSFDWISENTPENSGIAHWWDYGYWTQTVGERPSIADGGSHGEYMLYLLGRYGMTGQTREDALTYFKTNNISYLLFSEEEIGKYWAFSHIGSNKDFDRESTIGTFGLGEIREVRNGNLLIYRGGWNLDQDLVLDDGKVFKKGNTLLSEVSFMDDGSEGKVVLSDNSRSIEDPLYCVVQNGNKIIYGVDSKLKGCFVFMTRYDNDGAGNPAGALFYLSEKVVNGLFARLYIIGENVDGFNLVYRDNIPLGVYRGRIVGPKMIWEIDYPSNIESNPMWHYGAEEEEGFR